MQKTWGSVLGLGRSPGEGNGNPLQYSYLGNPMNRGAWWDTVPGVIKNQMWLSTCTHAHTHSSLKLSKYCINWKPVCVLGVLLPAWTHHCSFTATWEWEISDMSWGDASRAVVLGIRRTWIKLIARRRWEYWISVPMMATETPVSSSGKWSGRAELHLQLWWKV